MSFLCKIKVFHDLYASTKRTPLFKGSRYQLRHDNILIIIIIEHFTFLVSKKPKIEFDATGGFGQACVQYRYLEGVGPSRFTHVVRVRYRLTR